MDNAPKNKPLENLTFKEGLGINFEYSARNTHNKWGSRKENSKQYGEEQEQCLGEQVFQKN